MRFLGLLALGCFVLGSCLALGEGSVVPVRLLTEDLVNPLGIDRPDPRLSWWLDSKARGAQATAYEIQVASSLGKLQSGVADLWDSGRVRGDAVSAHYGGRKLGSGADAVWRVRVWDEAGHASAWSGAGRWRMGLLDQRAWGGAKWIGAEARLDPPYHPAVQGYHALEAKNENIVKWVQVDLGAMTDIDAVRLIPPEAPEYPAEHGFGFPIRFDITASDEPSFSNPTVLTMQADKDFPNPGARGATFKFPKLTARYVRVTALKLWNRRTGSEPYCFALGELEVLSGGKNVALGKPAKALDSVERSGWSLKQLTDGRVPALRSSNPKERPARTADQRSGIGAENEKDPPYAAVELRRDFWAAQRPVRAIVTVCGLGYCQLTIGGHRVGDHELDPAYSDFSKRVYVNTYDVTRFVRQGQVPIRALLGTGFYDVTTTDVWNFERAPWIAAPKLLFKLDVQYADGSRASMVSDRSWTYSKEGPLVYNSIRGGEVYDARRVVRHWKPAVVCPAPAGRLVAQLLPPIRRVTTRLCRAIGHPKPGATIYDAGVNVAGYAGFTEPGGQRRGSRVKLEFGENLNPDGTLSNNLAVFSPRFQTDEYVRSGSRSGESYMPKFSYNGFRYVQATGLDPRAVVRLWEVHTDPAPAGDFACSSAFVNRLHAAIRRTQLNNLHGIPTDCPHREKNGWTEDGCVTMEEAICNFQMGNFYRKWVGDMLDAQDPNGHAACIAPSPGWGKSRPDGLPGVLSDPWWGGALVRAPWQLYRYYGDLDILRETYPAMKRYLGYVAQHAPGDISWGQEGDWLEVGSKDGLSRRTPPELAGTAAYYYHATIVSAAAKLLGKPAEAAHYAALAERIKGHFNAKYFDASTALYAADSQTAQALPLYFGMTPPGTAPRVFDGMVRNVREVRDGHLSTGMVGTLYLFWTLMDRGEDELAYSILTKPGNPGFAHMIEPGNPKNGGTIWEDWDGDNSHDHPALGAIDAWIYQAISGLRPDDSAPGFRRFVVRPSVRADLTWARTSYDSVRGPIRVSWARGSRSFRLRVHVPAGSSARVYVPVGGSGSVSGLGRFARMVRREGGFAVVAVSSGDYAFTSPL
jgi:hypothetical protein